MTIGAKDKIHTIRVEDLLAEARRRRMPDDQAARVVTETLEQIRTLIAEVDMLPEVRKLVVERVDQITSESASTSSR